MADFTEEIQKQKVVRRPNKKNLSFSDFCDLKDTVAEGITGITGIALLSEVYKTELKLMKDGEKVATVKIEIGDEDGYDTLLARINDEIAEEAMGADAVFVEDTDKRNWTLRYTAKDGKDTISLTFNSDGGVVTSTVDNFVADSTKDKLEAWADTVAILSDGVNA